MDNRDQMMHDAISRARFDGDAADLLQAMKDRRPLSKGSREILAHAVAYPVVLGTDGRWGKRRFWAQRIAMAKRGNQLPLILALMHDAPYPMTEQDRASLARYVTSLHVPLPKSTRAKPLPTMTKDHRNLVIRRAVAQRPKSVSKMDYYGRLAKRFDLGVDMVRKIAATPA